MKRNNPLINSIMDLSCILFMLTISIIMFIVFLIIIIYMDNKAIDFTIWFIEFLNIIIIIGILTYLMVNEFKDKYTYYKNYK